MKTLESFLLAEAGEDHRIALGKAAGAYYRHDKNLHHHNEDHLLSGGKNSSYKEHAIKAGRMRQNLTNSHDKVYHHGGAQAALDLHQASTSHFYKHHTKMGAEAQAEHTKVYPISHHDDFVKKHLGGEGTPAHAAFVKEMSK